jgi:DNA-binding NtrC family response regulator
MPGMDGLEVLRQVQTRQPGMPVILLTAHGTVESAVEAMRGGAVNFLQKPFSPREIREAVDKALQEHDPSAPAAMPEEMPPSPTKQADAKPDEP